MDGNYDIILVLGHNPDKMQCRHTCFGQDITQIETTWPGTWMDTTWPFRSQNKTWAWA